MEIIYPAWCIFHTWTVLSEVIIEAGNTRARGPHYHSAFFFACNHLSRDNSGWKWVKRKRGKERRFSAARPSILTDGWRAVMWQRMLACQERLCPNASRGSQWSGDGRTWTLVWRESPYSQDLEKSFKFSLDLCWEKMPCSPVASLESSVCWEHRQGSLNIAHVFPRR